MLIDTLSIARDLRATELPTDQAEAIAAAIGRSVSEGTASKSDVETIRISLKGDIDLVRSSLDAAKHELRGELEKLRSQLLVSLIGTQVAIAGIILAVLKL